MLVRNTVKARACFSITSASISLEELSKKTSIKFDRLLVKDLPFKGQTELNAVHLGIIDSRGDSDNMDEHVRDLLSRINPLRDAIKGLPEACRTTITLNYFLEGSCYFGWELSPDVMQQLIELGVACMVIIKSNAKGLKRRVK